MRSSRRYFPGGLLQERVAWGYWATSLSVNRDKCVGGVKSYTVDWGYSVSFRHYALCSKVTRA